MNISFHLRQLGKGAFGEVYQGYLSNVTPNNTDLKVAVKVDNIAYRQINKNIIIYLIIL